MREDDIQTVLRATYSDARASDMCGRPVRVWAGVEPVDGQFAIGVVDVEDGLHGFHTFDAQQADEGGFGQRLSTAFENAVVAYVNERARRDMAEAPSRSPLLRMFPPERKDSEA